MWGKLWGLVTNNPLIYLKIIELLTYTGGECEIRTHEDREALPVFKTGAFNRSANSPFCLRIHYLAGFSPCRAVKRLISPAARLASATKAGEL